jgi:hypothetical protein
MQVNFKVDSWIMVAGSIDEVTGLFKLLSFSLACRTNSCMPFLLAPSQNFRVSLFAVTGLLNCLLERLAALDLELGGCESSLARCLSSDTVGDS